MRATLTVHVAGVRKTFGLKQLASFFGVGGIAVLRGVSRGDALKFAATREALMPGWVLLATWRR